MNPRPLGWRCGPTRLESGTEAPPEEVCFDCWIADDDIAASPKHLASDGDTVVSEGKVYTPWVCAVCGQHWLLVCDPADDSQTFVRCSR